MPVDGSEDLNTKYRVLSGKKFVVSVFSDLKSSPHMIWGAVLRKKSTECFKNCSRSNNAGRLLGRYKRSESSLP